MNPFEMVVLIVLITCIAGVLRARYRAQHGIIEDQDGNQTHVGNRDAELLQREVNTLKQRVATLERVITDERGSRELSREIESLRDR